MAYALLLSLLAGLPIPVGAWLAAVERIRPNWLENELRHGIIAFGGGALLAAVALVLVPEGSKHLPAWGTMLGFVGGGVAFMAADVWIQKLGGSVSQLTAMLLDYLPEAAALGAALAMGENTGFLLAVIIALQNLPEGFNACREIVADAPTSRRTVLISFSFMPLLGPVAAAIGYGLLADMPAVLGSVEVVAAGGIVYLIFQDIAPQSKLKNTWAPPLGAVLGFSLGLLGHLLIGG